MIDYTQYVKPDRVHSRIFTDPEVFEDELRNIFYKTWVYIGHESEIPHPGDYKVKTIGRRSVILTRDEHNVVHALMNRCRHRGSTVCAFPQGNASFFRCQYHGWTYRNSGELVGVTFPDGYEGDFDKSQMGLGRVPRLGSFRGFVFGSFAAEGPSLDEYLGPVKQVIDLAIDGSPTGTISVNSGVMKTVFRGNWKYVGMDGYHVNFVHSSIVDLNRNKAMANRQAIGGTNAYAGSSPNRTIDLGHGHVRLDTAQALAVTYDEFVAPRLKTQAGREYIESLEKKYGRDRVRDILITSRDPHLGFFPNLQLISSHIRVIHPISPSLTEVYLYPFTLDAAPDEINQNRLRGHEFFYGPAGFGQPDDAEMFERNHVGLQSEVDPWILLARGAGREKQLDDGTTAAHISDEVTQRGQMRAWLDLMSAGVSSADAGVSA